MSATDHGGATAGSGRSILPLLIVTLVALAGAVAFLFVVSHRRAPPRAIALHLGGSNTVGAELGPALVEGFLRSRSAQNVTREHNDPATEADAGRVVFVAGRLPSDGTDTVVSVEAFGSATAFTGLADGRYEIGMASRRIKEAERKALGDVKEAVIGLDGIAVVVHPINPVTSLDTDQVARIFRGDIQDWHDLGGMNGKIVVYARDANSGTWDTFHGLVLPSSPLRADATRFDSNEALVAAVASTPNAIGFTSLSVVKGAKVIAVGEPGAAAVTPSKFTIATETYPLTRRLYLYTTKPQPLGDALVVFAQSPEGQALVASAGFVDLRPESFAASTDGFTPGYRAATTGGRRVSVDFRFDAGGAQLDSRGARDIDRVAAYVKANHTRRLLLLGFADNQGVQAANASMSLERARTVQGLLKEKGIPSEAIGFGDTIPIASNLTARGRERNRRVEVWAFH